MKRRKALKQFRRVQKNLLRDKQVVEELLDEMATKWAITAESLRASAMPANIQKKPN